MGADLRLMRLLVMGVLLFGLSSIVYGYLTGASFMLKGALPGAISFDFVVWGVLFACVYGVAKYASSQSYKVWFFAFVISSLPVLVLVFGFGETNDWGRLFRFYVSVIAFYVLPAFSVYEIFFKKAIAPTGRSVKPTVLLLIAVLSFLVGLGVYLSKESLIFQGNRNFAVQYLLSLLCIAVPLCASVSGVYIKIKMWKGQGIEYS